MAFDDASIKETANFGANDQDAVSEGVELNGCTRVGIYVEVISGDQTLFAEPKRDHDHEGVMASDRAMDEILARKAFSIERAQDFEFFSYGSSAAEIREFWDRYNDYDPEPKENDQLAFEDKVYARAEQVRKELGDDAEISVHVRVRMARLRPH